MSMDLPKDISLPFGPFNAPPDEENHDQFPESLVEFFLQHCTQKGDKVFDPFMGFGTTAFVAEAMGRIPYGIEADERRYQWGAGQIEHWKNIKCDDAANMLDYGFPKMDFCITSPPYMPIDDDWNPINPDEPFGTYEGYLTRLEEIFSCLPKVMKPHAPLIVQADNLMSGDTITPLIKDFTSRISKSFSFERSVTIKWSSPTPSVFEGYTHTTCLIFKTPA